MTRALKDTWRFIAATALQAAHQVQIRETRTIRLHGDCPVGNIL
jgi:hypothetical protein